MITNVSLEPPLEKRHFEVLGIFSVLVPFKLIDSYNLSASDSPFNLVPFLILETQSKTLCFNRKTVFLWLSILIRLFF